MSASNNPSSKHVLGLLLVSLCLGAKVDADRHPNAFHGLEKALSAHVPDSNAWNEYLAKSDAAKQRQDAILEAERAVANRSTLLDAPEGRNFPKLEKLSDEWFLTAKAADFAETIRSYQSPSGGWSKRVDFQSGPRRLGQEFGPSKTYVATFDNNATIPQIRYLARSYRILRDPRDREAMERALAFIRDSQFPNGGWPQIYPLASGYHDCITYNDRAMINVAKLLDDIAKGHPDFDWLPKSEKAKARESLARAIDCILATQIEIDGKKLGWAQQHHPLTLAPAPARAFEMTSLSSLESSQIVEFLLAIDSPSPEIVHAIESAVAWLEATAIKGYSYQTTASGDRILAPDTTDKPLWARFYEIDSNRPIFGDRDYSVHYKLDEISTERRNGYAWYTDDPATTIARYQRWKKKRENAP